MQFDTKQRQEALRAFIRQNGLKVAPWERAAGLGVGTLRKFLERDRGTMTDKTYEKLATAAADLLDREIRAEELKGTQPPAETSLTKISQMSQPTPIASVVIPLPPLVLYRSAPSGARGGSTLIFQHKVGEVERLRKYEFADKAFCIEATDDLMSPFARARDTVIVDPDRIPRKGDECLFVRDPSAEPKVTVLRHLIDILATAWQVCEHNGRKAAYELPFSDYPNAWPVVGVIRP